MIEHFEARESCPVLMWLASACSNGSRVSTSGGESRTTRHTEFGRKSRAMDSIFDMAHLRTNDQPKAVER